MKNLLFIVYILFFVSGCNETEIKSGNESEDSRIKFTNFQTKIKIIKNQEVKKDENQFVNYDITGERKISFTLNNENNVTTKNIVAYSKIKTPYDKINFNLMEKKLSKEFILKCSACHNDYANGIIGPSLLNKTDTQIFDMISKYKNNTKTNVLMSELINDMNDEDIKRISNEIYEFNKQFRR